MRLPPAGSRVQTDSGKPLHADAVVLAADVSGLQRIVDASPTFGDQPWRSRVEAMRAAAPFVVQCMCLDRLADAQLKSLSHGLQWQPTHTRHSADRGLVTTYQRDTPTAASRSARDRSVSPITSLMSGTTSPPAR
jgi:hypothetical protein